MTLTHDLAAVPDEWEVPAGDEERERFRVEGERQAVWAMRRARDVARRRAEIQAIAEEEIDRIQRWASDADAPLARDARYFEGLLIRYALDVRAADPRRKSVTTPYGTVRTRETGGGWTASPEALEWARVARPELVKVTETFALSDAKRTLTATEDGVVDPATGDLVPGITVAPRTVTATVEVVTEGGTS